MQGAFILREFDIPKKYSLHDVVMALDNYGLILNGIVHINGYDVEALYNKELSKLTINFQQKPKPGEYVFLKIDEIINSISRRITGTLS